MKSQHTTSIFFLPLTLASFFLSIFSTHLFAGNYTWTGTTSSSWTTSTNWSPNGNPSTGDSVTITAGTYNCMMALNITLSWFIVTDDTIDFNGYTLIVTDEATVTDGLLTNGTLLINGAMAAAFNGGTVSVTVNVTADKIHFSGSTFNNLVTAVKLSSASSTGTGGCTFSSAVTLIDSGSGYWTFASGDPDTWNDKVSLTQAGSGTVYFAHNAEGNEFAKSVTFTNTADGSIYCDYYGTSTFHDSIIVNATGAGFILFGGGGGMTTLDTSIIAIGSPGLSSSATISLGGILQQDASKSISLTGTGSSAIIFSSKSIFEGRITASTPGLELSGSRFTNVCTFTHTGAGTTSSRGGCYFGDSTLIIHDNPTGGALYTGTMTSDTFASPVTIQNLDQGKIAVVNARFSDNAVFENYAAVAGTIGATTALSAGNTFLVGDAGNCLFEDTLTLMSDSASFAFGTTHGAVTFDRFSNLLVDSDYVGNLHLMNVSYEATEALNIPFEDNPGILLLDTNNQFTPQVTCIVKRIQLNGNTFDDSFYLKTTCEDSDTSKGGNTFNGITTFVDSNMVASKSLVLAKSYPDDFNKEVTFKQYGSGKIYPAYTQNSTFSGDIVIDGTSGIDFGYAGGKVIIDGEADHILSKLGDYKPTFRKLEMKKDAGLFTLTMPITIPDSVIFTKGYIATDSANLLILPDNSIVVGASDSSFVAGPVKKIGNDSFTFPIGSNLAVEIPESPEGYYYIRYFKPLSITAPSYTFDAFTAKYNYGEQALGDSTDTTLHSISNCDYWILNRDTGNSKVKVGLFWNSMTCGISDTTYIRPSVWYSNKWKDLGHGIVSGDNSLGEIFSSDSVDNFGSFLIATAEIPINPTAYSQGFGFVTNSGQLIGTDSAQHYETLFYGPFRNADVFFNEEEISFSLIATHSDSPFVSIDSIYRFEMEFVDPSDSIELSVRDTTQGYFNYFFGDDSIVHCLTYQEIKFSNVYAGIDLLFYNSDGNIRFDFDSSADYSAIQFRFSGSDSIILNDSGQLIVYTPLGSINFDKLFGYEKVNGKWKVINAVLEINEEGIILIDIDAVDEDATQFILSIGPIGGTKYENKLKWSTYYGGSGAVSSSESFYDVFINDDDFIYACGVTNNVNFPVTLNAIQYPSRANGDAVVVKFNPDRSRDWATYYGGDYPECATDIVADGNGNAIFTGYSNASGTLVWPFPICTGCSGYVQSNLNGASDAFIVKLSSDGQQRLMSTYYGGPNSEGAIALAIDHSQNVYIAGQYYTASSTNTIPLPSTFPIGAFYQDFKGTSYDGWIAEFNSTNDLIWATFIGGDEINVGGWIKEEIEALATDDYGNLFALGVSSSTSGTSINTSPITSNNSSNFPIVETYNTVCAPFACPSYLQQNNNNSSTGYLDGILCKFNSSHALEWSTFFGGDGLDFSRELAVSPLNGDLVIIGETQDDTNFPFQNLATSNWNVNTLNGPSDIFIAKFNFWGHDLAWSTLYGGPYYESASAVEFNSNGFFYLAGVTEGDLPTYPSTNGGYYEPVVNYPNGYQAGYHDGFLLKFSPSGVRKYCTNFGGEGYGDGIMGLSVQKNGGNVVSVGYTNSTNFPTENYLSSAVDYQQSQTIDLWDCFISNFKNNCVNCRDHDEFEDVELDNAELPFIIFPNPNTGNFVIQSINDPFSCVSIYNYLGEKIFDSNVNYIFKYEISIPDLSNGLYILEATIKSKIIRKRFLLYH